MCVREREGGGRRGKCICGIVQQDLYIHLQLNLLGGCEASEEVPSGGE